MRAEIKALLFDKDGTLFDFHATWGAWAATFFLDVAGGDALRAGEISARLGYDYKNRRFSRDSVIIAGTPDEITALMEGAVPGWDAHEIKAHVNKVAAEVVPVAPVPLRPLLAGFRARGLKLGVATNDAITPTLAHLGRAGIDDMFDFIAGSDSGYGAKPETGMQRAFCNSVVIAPENCVMVGDSAHDLIAGRAAGMQTVAVLTGLAGADALRALADVVLADIGALPGWIG